MAFTSTTREVADSLRLSDQTLRRLRSEGVLRPGVHFRTVGVGTSRPPLLWDPAAVDAAIAQRSCRVSSSSARADDATDDVAPAGPISIHAGRHASTIELTQELDLYEKAYRDAQSQLTAAAHAIRQLARAAQNLRPETLPHFQAVAIRIQMAQDRLAGAPLPH